MIEPTEITLYPFTLTKTGITGLHSIQCRGKFCRILKAPEPFLFRLNGGNQFRGELGMTFPQIINQIEVEKHTDQEADELDIEIVVANSPVGYDAIQLAGSISTTLTDFELFAHIGGASGGNISLVANTEKQIWGGDITARHVMVKHVSGTADIYVGTTELLVTNGVRLSPGESFVFPIKAGSSLWGFSANAAACHVTPFLKS
jgi:hypothetical protein